MTPEAKVRLARELLIQATREIRAREKRRIAADLCQCGHRRDKHTTVTCSINYTGGFCMRRGCGCHWFLMASEGID